LVPDFRHRPKRRVMVFRINGSLKQIVCCVVDLLELRDGIKVFADNPVSILKGDGSNDVDIQFFPYLAYAALGNTEMFSAIGDAFPLSKHLR
jgi:hypothetical protein